MTKRLILILAFLFCVSPAFADTIYYSETWANLSVCNANSTPNFGTDSSIGCCYPTTENCTPTPVFLTASDQAPGGVGGYSVIFDPSFTGNFGCTICNTSNLFSLGQGTEFYVSYWMKHGANNLFDSGAGKNPDILGTGGLRVVIACPGSFDEVWSIPTPPHLSAPYQAYHGKLIPSLYIETQPSGLVAYPSDSMLACTSGGTGASVTQNVNVSSPYYIERGYWYRVTLYIKLKIGGPNVGDGGRYRLWIKKEGESEVEILDSDLGTNCTRYLNTLGSSSSNVYNHFRVSPMWNDHGGAGTTSGWEYLIDDAYVTDYKMADEGDSSPSKGVGLTISGTRLQ